MTQFCVLFFFSFKNKMLTCHSVEQDKGVFNIEFFFIRSVN